MTSTLFYGLRIFVSFCLAVLIPWYLHHITLAIPLILGVVAAAITDLDDSFSGRLQNLTITLICFCIASFSVELLFPYPILMTLGLLVSTFGFILLGALGQRYATIAFGALLIAAYTMLGYNLYSTIYTLPLLLLAGALGYNIITLIEHLLFPIRPVQDNLAKTFQYLGAYFIAKSALFDPDDERSSQDHMLDLAKINQTLVNMLNQTRTSLFNRLKSDRGQRNTRRMLSYYFIAQDIHERVSASHMDYEALKKQYAHQDIPFRCQQLLYRQGLACQAIARSVLQKQRYEHAPRFAFSLNMLESSLNSLEHKVDTKWLLINALRQLLSNLRAIDAQLANLDSEQNLSQQSFENKVVDDEPLTGFRSVYLRIKQEFTPYSSLFRHAVRMGIVLSVDYLIIQLTDIQHGYWIILTSLFVCQPNYTATKRRLSLRVLGTIAGILAGIPLLYFVPTTEGQLFLIVVSGVCFFLFRQARYAYATAFITLLTLLCFNLLGEGLSVAIPRLISTLIGCGVAWLAVSFIWPDWHFRTISRLISQLHNTNSDYLSAIIVQYQQGKNNHVDYRLARRRAHNSDTAFATTVSTMSSEPNTSEETIKLGFQLLALNHTLLSYISTLGAHRHPGLSVEILSMLRQLTQLMASTQPFPDEQSLHDFAQQVELFFAQHDELPQAELLILQQISLILSILPKFSLTAEQLITANAQRQN